MIVGFGLTLVLYYKGLAILLLQIRGYMISLVLNDTLPLPSSAVNNLFDNQEQQRRTCIIHIMEITNYTLKGVAMEYSMMHMLHITVGQLTSTLATSVNYWMNTHGSPLPIL